MIAFPFSRPSSVSRSGPGAPAPAGGDEPTLFREASRGDLAAAEDLLAQHLRGLEAYVRRRGADLPAGKESASDLVQSVCREVLERLQSERLEYRGPAEFRAWLYEAALLKIRGRRRYWSAQRRDPARERRPPAEPRGEAERGGVLPAQAGPTPSADAAAREELERARRLLGELPPRYRQVIELARVEGLRHAEIARRMGVRETASRMLLSRALARLATLKLRGEED